MKKRLLSILLATCMVLTLVPTAALATEAYTRSIADSSLYFRVYGSDTQYSTDNSNWINYDGFFTITGSSTSDTAATNTVIVISGTHNITLSDCSIGAATDTGSTVSSALSPFDIQGGTVNLTLMGSNRLYSANLVKAGLRVAAAASLVVSADSTGSLDACCRKNDSIYGIGAGIGGNSAERDGTVIINGGEVSAYSSNGAGIGNGFGSGNSNFGNVTITGGTVVAQSNGGQGIGHGSANTGSGELVTITGGSVNASRIGGTLQNGSAVSVQLYTLTLSGVSSATAVTTLCTTPEIDYTYGTTGMKTDGSGKLYVYLPAEKTAASVTAAGKTYTGDITGNAATLYFGYRVSGTVDAGTTGADVSGLTVNLYASTDTTFTTSVGSATTNGSGAYTINVPNGSYVARVAGAADSYVASTSETITVSDGTFSGANITLSRAAYSGSAAPTPSLTSKTDTQVVLNSVTVSGQTVEYGINISNVTPSDWQDGTTFTGLTANTPYYFFARVKQAGAVEAGGVSDALTVSTKTSAATAPVAPTIGTDANKPTSSSITVSTVTGNEYYISTSATADWSGTPNGYFKATVSGTQKFDSLTLATQYYIHVRVAETDDAMPSASASVMQHTLPTTPETSVVTVDYAAETISFVNTYEVSVSTNFTPTIDSGSALTAGTTYYVRVAAKSGVPASEAVSFTVAARPAAPTVITAANITKTGTSITIVNTVDGQEYLVNGTWYTPASGKVEVTGLAEGTDYSIVTRVKATANLLASLSSDVLTVKTKTAPATAPGAPTIGTGGDKPTSGSITVSTEAGKEYYISTSATANWSGTPSGYFKATVSGTHKFDSLSPATQYYIHVRVAETDDAMPSASNSISRYTLPTTPAAGTGYSIDYGTEKITVTGGYEVNTDAGFGAGTAITTSLNPNTTYYIRVKANGGVPASEARSFTIPARPATPTGITADKTKDSITITTVTGQEYKIGVGGVWQNSGSFTGLSANTDYTVYTRVKAVSSGSVSFASEAYSTTIKTKSDGGLGFTLPSIAVSPTYAPGNTLNDIPLQTGWTWSAPATIHTVTNSGYTAVYTPTDTDTVDYSGVAGYANTSGTVTITRTISLTVNRATPTAADFTYAAPTMLGYDTTTKSATVTAKDGISGMGTVLVKYYDNDGAVVDAPTNAGTYTAKISVAQGDNYAAATDITDDAWTFTITKATQASLSITKKPTSITYGETFKLETTGGSSTNAVTWAVTPGGSATLVPVAHPVTGEIIAEVTITGVGETTITATKAADGNYSADVKDTYTFTPAKRLITVDAPSATGGWTKAYDGKTDFDKSFITVGGITNKVGSDVVNVSVQSAAYDTTAIGSSNKTLTITYAIDGTKSVNYSAPNNTVISDASITAATPTITLKNKTEAYTGKKIEIDAADVKGVTGGTTPDGAITYTYYAKDTCTDGDKTTVDKSGTDTIGGAPKNAGTYYVKATIAASGNYTTATSTAVTLTIYYPSSGGNNPSTPVNADKSSAPVIVDGKKVDMGTSEVKDSTTTVKVDQSKMTEQLKSAKDSVVIPVTSKTGTAATELVVQNVEDMAKKGMTLTVQASGVNYNLPASAVDTGALLKGLGATDSSKVTFTVTMTELSKSSVTIKNGTLMLPPVEFTVTAAYSGKSVAVENFEAYVQRDIELPSGVDHKTITTAVVVEANGTQRHVPTEVYSKSGKWYAKINSMTNSTYALIQSSASFSDSIGKWYDAVVTEMASRKVISGIGENMFAGERAITRAEFAAIIVRALGLPTTGKATFADVATSAWYYGAVGTAFEYGIVGGKGDGIFDPSANITREEAMVMVARAAKLCGMDTTDSGAIGLTGFEDATQISSWAHDSAVFNVHSGLIKGSNGKIDSRADITRAETATVVLRLLQKAGLVDIRTVV